MIDPARHNPPPDSPDGSPGASQARISLRQGKRPARILLLDDEAIMQEIFQRLLSELFRDFDLAACLDSDQALQKISRRPPDLLITDYAHPGLRADEMLHLFIRMPVKFPILISSGYVHTNPELAARLASFPGLIIELLHKPFTKEALEAQILMCLRRAGEQTRFA